MPNPHFDVSIVQRSKRQSAIAAAAYQSADRLYSEYDLKFRDYRNKEHVVHTEILLPMHAPSSYFDRETLWNEAEKIEKQHNSQLARKIVLTLPREVPMEHYPQMVKEYCEEHFVSKGMCCDLAIHDPDPPSHNPHCHIQLTMRAFDTHGNWMPKSRKVYDLDENGERIRLPSGAWKSHKEKTVDWDEQYHCEEWRHGWEVVQNKYLELVHSPARIDLRSYERQGIDTIPTVHMGPAVTQMERRGILTNIGNLNRDIRAVNRLMKKIRETIRGLCEWIEELMEARKNYIAEQKQEPPTLAELLEDASEYDGMYDDSIAYLNEQDLKTGNDLDRALNKTEAKVTEIQTKMKPIADRMRVISKIRKSYQTYTEYRDVHEKYQKKFWKGSKAKFAEAHKKELDAYNSAYHFLKKHGLEEPVNIRPLLNEYGSLKLKHTELSEQLEPLEHDLGSLREIRGHVDDILDRQEREQRECEREKNKERKNTSVLQQKILESRQKLREQRESRKKKRGEMER